MFYGSLSVKIILLLLLFYQYTFCQENTLFKNLVTWGAPIRFFDECNLIFDDPSTPDNSQSKTMLCYHPHGVMAYGVTLLTFQEKFLQRFVRLGSRVALHIPWGGMFLKLCGIQGINPDNLNKLMRNGENLLMVPGGYEEATITNYNEDRVYVKDRKGFIKYALKYGYTVHPCYCFNENKTFYYFTSVKIGLWLNKFKIPAVVCISKFLNILPNNNVVLSIVVGKGFQIPEIQNPTVQQIDQYHQMYLRELKELFDKYKEKFGGSSELKIY